MLKLILLDNREMLLQIIQYQDIFPPYSTFIMMKGILLSLFPNRKKLILDKRFQQQVFFKEKGKNADN
jgi:hypothetical protein